MSRIYLVKEMNNSDRNEGLLNATQDLWFIVMILYIIFLNRFYNISCTSYPNTLQAKQFVPSHGFSFNLKL